ncbi:hypothetical protein Hs30E_00110 [Lactococcus hodotermopsidis]|uniref:Bacterial EndoU nuclease domain-containing protein n=1 Tax=Pseudolactococcus hodotermopsidis TaxID=2709157 RepID=A0A6A0B7Z2_9LACT|nr:EndoU domain-containing protein [Lactococcus hodotermopsidis]GFH41460.1 hypothetical protein Hs30E_00110 [Lactococcus hodotermopsidis]
MPYEDPKTKEVKIMWFIDKDGVRIFDEELQDYVEKYGKNFVGMYEIVGWEKTYELDLAARRKGDGKNYLTDGQLPSGWEKWGQAGGFADSIYWYSSKSGLLDLALIAGLSYAASKSQTKAGTGVNVANVMDDVKIKVTNPDYSDLKNTENFKTNTPQHVLGGEVNKKGKAVGYHTENNIHDGLDVELSNVTVPDEFGVYKANVTINETLKNGKSSFFPKNWSNQKIIDEVDYAFKNMKHRTGSKRTDIFVGKKFNGIDIQFKIKISYIQNVLF